MARVVWITGLSGAGKTSLARALLPLLPEPRLLLDGDELREALAPLVRGYGRAERRQLALTYARLAKLAAGQAATVVCATISLFHEVHAWNRANLPGYFEVFLDPPPEILAGRDYKKVYQAGRGPAVGRELEPEYPLAPDLRLSDPALGPEAAARLVLESLRAGD